jgi:hypothetical protein
MPLCKRCRRYELYHDGVLPPRPEIGLATAKVLAAAERLGSEAPRIRLAEEAGVAVSTVYRVLNGDRTSRTADARRLERLAAPYITAASDDTPAVVAARMPDHIRAEYLRLVERVSGTRKPKTLPVQSQC